MIVAAWPLRSLPSLRTPARTSALCALVPCFAWEAFVINYFILIKLGLGARSCREHAGLAPRSLVIGMMRLATN